MQTINSNLKLTTTQVLNTYGIIPTVEEITAFDTLKLLLPDELIINILKYQQPIKEEIEYNNKVSKWHYSKIPKQCYSTMNYIIPVLIGFVGDDAVELHNGQYGHYIKFKNVNFSVKEGKYGHYIKYNNKFVSFKYDNQKAILEKLK